MIILAIETSCDETAVAIAEFKSGKIKVLSNIISSQVKMHSKYGGVVPSLASRMHLKNIAPVLSRALKSAKIGKSKIDYIAATNGPGLAPALMIGISAAKTLSYALDKPLVGIHHIEGHIYANWLKKELEVRNLFSTPIKNWKLENKKLKVRNERLKIQKSENSEFQVSSFRFQDYELWQPEFPILCLIVSGGHTQLILMKKDLNYKVIGDTLDDAAGEAFDKVAKLLNLGYPGGPLIEKIAKKGDKNKYKFTRPMIGSNDYNFSFSGLKTAVLYEVCSCRDAAMLRLYNDQYKRDMAASFQQAVIDVLISKTIKAAKEYKVKNIILGGGVSANKKLQKQFKNAISRELPITNYQLPITSLSTDNALMIAIAAYYHIVNNKNIGSWRNIKVDANLKL